MSDDDESSKPVSIKCGKHGKRTAAVLCGHLADHLKQPTEVVLGFVENSSDPADLQAWCDDCEQMFLREDGKTEVFLAFNKMCVVCDQCYGRAKQLHTPPASRPN